VDQEVGRIIDNLKANAELDNTFVLFVSDNGACPYDRKLPKVDLEPTGTDASFGDSTGWAWARNTPFRYYKQNQFEGGIATPAIVHWPKGIHQNTPKIIDQPAHLIDVLPTLAAITQSPIPEKWDARQLRPVSGQSLTPIFQGRNLERQAPLHFLFSSDRGLRDENWKIVSFRNEPWELYDLSSDRTELNNLAKRHPDRLKEMIDRWTEMSRNVLHAPQRAMAPVKEESEPHRHPEWTNFERELGDSNSARKKNRTKNRNGLRARKNTQMKIIDGVIQLTFTGEDPGIAMNLTPHDLSKGPYLVRFLLSGGCKDAGELFYTTSPKETLPKGERLTFAVHGEATWKEIEIPIDTSSKIHQLRIDVCDGPGEAKIDQLELVDQNGKQLMAWPATQ
ncbi:sulfatase-like hydrolase/transferase, partial [bacterium]|nr:sulfatase-like hydrolase/transferase [bacterium]